MGREDGGERMSVVKSDVKDNGGPVVRKRRPIVPPPEDPNSAALPPVVLGGLKMENEDGSIDTPITRAMNLLFATFSLKHLGDAAHLPFRLSESEELQELVEIRRIGLRRSPDDVLPPALPPQHRQELIDNKPRWVLEIRGVWEKAFFDSSVISRSAAEANAMPVARPPFFAKIEQEHGLPSPATPPVDSEFRVRRDTESSVSTSASAVIDRGPDEPRSSDEVGDDQRHPSPAPVGVVEEKPSDIPRVETPALPPPATTSTTTTSVLSLLSEMVPGVPTIERRYTPTKRCPLWVSRLRFAKNLEVDNLELDRRSLELNVRPVLAARQQARLTSRLDDKEESRSLGESRSHGESPSSETFERSGVSLDIRGSVDRHSSLLHEELKPSEESVHRPVTLSLARSLSHMDVTDVEEPEGEASAETDDQDDLDEEALPIVEPVIDQGLTPPRILALGLHESFFSRSSNPELVRPMSDHDLMKKSEATKLKARAALKKYESFSERTELGDEEDRAGSLVIGSVASGTSVKSASLLRRTESLMPAGGSGSFQSRLHRYRSRLEGYFDRRAAALRQCHHLKDDLGHNIRHELTTLEKWGAAPLKLLLRDLVSTRILRLELQEEMEIQCIQLLTEKKLSLDSIGESDPITWNYALSESPPFICTKNPDVALLFIRVQALDERCRLLAHEYVSARNRLWPAPTREDRMIAICAILDDTVHDIDLGFHEFDSAMQSRFDMLLRDQRTDEGRRLKKFVEECNRRAAVKELPLAIEILGFIENQIHEMVHESVVLKNDALRLSKLRLYIHRFVFPLITNLTFLFDQQRSMEKDERFAHQSSWLRNLKAEEFDYDAFGPKRNQDDPRVARCFNAAIFFLEGISYETVPVDMLHCVLKCAASVNDGARLLLDPSEELGADDLFPIFTYLTIHSGIPRVCECLAFLDHFTSQKEKYTELGYCLTTLEASVTLICQFSPQEFPALAGRTVEGYDGPWADSTPTFAWDAAQDDGDKKEAVGEDSDQERRPDLSLVVEDDEEEDRDGVGDRLVIESGGETAPVTPVSPATPTEKDVGDDGGIVDGGEELMIKPALSADVDTDSSSLVTPNGDKLSVSDDTEALLSPFGEESPSSTTGEESDSDVHHLAPFMTPNPVLPLNDSLEDGLLSPIVMD